MRNKSIYFILLMIIITMIVSGCNIEPECYKYNVSTENHNALCKSYNEYTFYNCNDGYIYKNPGRFTSVYICDKNKYSEESI